MSKRSFTCCPPPLAFPPEASLPFPSPTLPVLGITVFQETSPWCQKGWGPLR